MDKIQGLADRLTGSSTQGNTDAGQTVRTFIYSPILLRPEPW
jgi:hypothetical protein